jgi:serine/threonine protein kinase
MTLEKRMENLVGKTVDKFEIKEQIGQGGMATVYKAFDTTLRRTVALKTLLPNLAADSELVQRFHREAVTAANLKHPHIVVIYEVATYEGQDYIVMEFLKGVTVGEEIKRLGTLPLPRVCKILSQLASALDYAHSQGLIHRDIKPGNVILGDDDHATLTDFGLVKATTAGVQLTQAGTTVGTLEYMSPEQVVGDEIDYRSDIYSLGVLVYEMLVGRLPYAGPTPIEVLQNLVYEPPTPPRQVKPDVPPQVEQVLLKTLAKRPEERYQRAGEMARAFEQALTAPPVQEIGWLLRAQDGRECPLREGENSVGRVADKDLTVAEAPVSRHHARITCNGPRCEVVDLNSTNGTYVNGERIEPGKAHPLQPGDELCFGTVCFETVYTSPPEGDDSGDKTMLVNLR